MKDPVTWPPALNVQVAVRALTMSGRGVLVRQSYVLGGPASPGTKLLPVNVTAVPGGPEIGFRIIFGTGDVTVNEAEASSGAPPPPSIVTE